MEWGSSPLTAIFITGNILLEGKKQNKTKQHNIREHSFSEKTRGYTLLCSDREHFVPIVSPKFVYLLTKIKAKGKVPKEVSI